jgi:LPXTG-site transpeptidase (sortase) family protein
LPASGFAPGVITILPDMPVGAYQALPALEMQIPAIGLTSDIVGLSMTDRIWDVSWLGDKLGYLEETAFPTWNGNSVITGHVYDAQGQPGPFNQLHTLRYGDKVTIQSFGQTYTYEVRDVLTVAPDDFKAAFKHQDNSWITLLTCQGYDAESGTYRSRVLVRAVLVDIK